MTKFQSLADQQSLQTACVNSNNYSSFCKVAVTDQLEQAKKHFAGINLFKLNSVIVIKAFYKFNEFRVPFGIASEMIVGK